MNESLAASGSHMRLLTWAKHFLRHLLSITHRQWLYRNAKIHIRKLEGKTEREHVDIIEEVRDMMLVDPDEELLPCHRHLLEQDFLQLGEGTSVNFQYWLAKNEFGTPGGGGTSPSTGHSLSNRRYHLYEGHSGA